MNCVISIVRSLMFILQNERKHGNGPDIIVFQHVMKKYFIHAKFCDRMPQFANVFTPFVD